MRNTIFVRPEPFISIQNDQSAENVARAKERKFLTVFLPLIAHSKSRLDVDLPSSCIDDEIYLVLSQLASSVHDMLNLHDSDIYIISTSHEFAEYRILHKMRLFLFTKAELRIADAKILGIVFRRIVKIARGMRFLSFMVLRPS